MPRGCSSTSPVRIRASGEPTTYVARFTEIAAAEGEPYRDFPVEYPPVSLAAIEVTAGTNSNETGANLVWFTFLCDLAVVAALAFGWGPRTAVAYLFLPRRCSASCIRPSTSSP
jgi:hypothetical protein